MFEESVDMEFKVVELLIFHQSRQFIFRSAFSGSFAVLPNV